MKQKILTPAEAKQWIVDKQMHMPTTPKDAETIINTAKQIANHALASINSQPASIGETRYARQAILERVVVILENRI